MDGYLSKLSLFRTLPPTQLAQLGDLVELRRFRKGEVVFEEGRPADFVWIIKRGLVYLVKRTPQGGLTTIFVMTSDEALCGVSAFEHGTYSAGAVAATESQLLKIPAKAFAQLLAQYPEFTKAVLLTCCLRMRHMGETISLAQAPVAQRLAFTLLRLRSTFGKTIPITHQELARMTGTRWETSIRTLSTMKRHGWITSSRGKVTILAPEKLGALFRHRTSPR